MISWPLTSNLALSGRNRRELLLCLLFCLCFVVNDTLAVIFSMVKSAVCRHRSRGTQITDCFAHFWTKKTPKPTELFISPINPQILQSQFNHINSLIYTNKKASGLVIRQWTLGPVGDTVPPMVSQRMEPPEDVHAWGSSFVYVGCKHALGTPPSPIPFCISSALSFVVQQQMTLHMAGRKHRNKRFCQADELQPAYIFNLFPRKTRYCFYVCTSRDR